jgi:hypothetical protein
VSGCACSKSVDSVLTDYSLFTGLVVTGLFLPAHLLPAPAAQPMARFSYSPLSLSLTLMQLPTPKEPKRIFSPSFNFLLLSNSYCLVFLLYRTAFNYLLSMPLRQYARKLLCWGLIDGQV